MGVVHASVLAQVYSDKVVGKKNAELIDSMKATEYPYALPIWGKKAAAMGFNLPYSAGIGINYLWQESDLVIDNLQIGFNNGPLYNWMKLCDSITLPLLHPDLISGPTSGCFRFLIFMG